MNQPLAVKYRPKTFEDFVGQVHIIPIIKKMIENDHLSNLILYGPSGTGKTTLATIIASLSNKKLFKINATTSSSKDLKDVFEQLDKLDESIILYIDEIQYFNKKQQQTLLEYIENGDIILICSTTENPYFYIYNAIISRSIIFEFKPLVPNDINFALNRIIKLFSQETDSKIDIEDKTISYLASKSGGDVRKAINSLELLISTSSYYDHTYHISYEMAENLALSPLGYDRDGDNHYDLLSCLQKSIRGSDPDASIFYLAKLLSAKDLISPCRRLLVIASEDVGLANSNVASIVKSLVDSALQLGLPEARIPLAHAVILMALSPKSNACINAIDAALDDINNGLGKEIPSFLKDSHYDGAKYMDHGNGYLYPHNYPNHYVKQTYLPDDIKDKIYYRPQENKNEQAYKAYWDKIKK